MTFIIELDLDIINTHLPAEIQVSMLNGLAPRVLNDRQTDTRTHGHTDGTDFIPSTAYAGGKN